MGFIHFKAKELYKIRPGTSNQSTIGIAGRRDPFLLLLLLDIIKPRVVLVSFFFFFFLVALAGFGWDFVLESPSWQETSAKASIVP